MKTLIWILGIKIGLVLVGVVAWKRWHHQNEVFAEDRRRADLPRGIMSLW